MKKPMKKKDLSVVASFFIILAFFLPFIIRNKNESNLTVFAVALTAVGAIATLFTLFIAFILYDRFGLKNRFISNKTDKVLQLVDFLKGKYIMADTSKIMYNLGTNRDKINNIRLSRQYQTDKNKIVIINYERYREIWTKELYEIKRSYWLPRKIKRKLDFLEFNILYPIEQPNDEKYIKLFTESKEQVWKAIIPEITFEKFLIDLDDLVKSIEKWLKVHSNIKIDFNLGESEKYPDTKA
ncbi:hypothetical protein B4N84_07540 [Flavobacterium sp. IR1]|nr:hypothetical protein B4N84_07540 [Flavobacterium sp. IR1]